MNAQDWLDLLPIVADRKWCIDAEGLIRDRDGRCPMCALAHEVSGGDVSEYMRWLPATEEVFGCVDTFEVVRIVCAADDAEALLRADLERALGLRQ